MYQGMGLLIALLVLPCNIVAAPSIGLPINAQVPPVARISQAFNFTFADTTFSSSNGGTNYTLSNAPAWLQLDKSSRTFSGTPGPNDVGSSSFGITATDDTGSTRMPVTLVVSSSPGPKLGTPIEDQLSTQSGYQSPDTLLLLPSSALSISFSPDTFTDTSHDTMYYALCANNTPLPSWIAFNPGSLSFSGTAPHNTSPDELPQDFDIHFTASDVPGFSAAVASFRIILENHIFAFETQIQLVNMTDGMPFTYNGLPSSLTLDGHTVDRATVREIHADKPDWVSFDESSWNLSGIPPNLTDTQNITITATDVYGESATATIILQMAAIGTTELFESPLATVNATIGDYFDYTFNTSITAPLDTKLSVDLGAASSWLQFNGSDMELSGQVPSDLKPQEIVINVTATQGSRSQSEPLTISVQSATHSSDSRSTDAPSPSISSQSAASSPTSASSAKSPDNGQDSRSHRSRIAAAIAVPVIMVCLFLIFASCFVYRRRRRENTCLSASKSKISRPFISDAASHKDSIGEMIEKPPAAHKSAPSRPPIIDFPGFRSSMASKRRSLFRLSRGTTEEAPQTPKVDTWQEYVQALSVDKPKAAAQPQFSLVPEEQASSRGEGSRFSSRKHPSRSSRPSGVVNYSPTKRSRQRKRRSDMSFASSGFLSRQRASGFGHGQNGSSFGTSCWGYDPIGVCPVGVGHGNRGPPNWGITRSSWRNPSVDVWSSTESSIKPSDTSSSGYNESERSQNFASAMRSFPRPPTFGTLEHISRPQTSRGFDDEKRPTVRAVQPEGPQTYGLSLHEFNKSRARRRQYRNTFFAAKPSSRASSHPNWMHAIPSSPILSPTQSMSSSGGRQRGGLVGREKADSRPSSPATPSRLSPPQSRPSSRGLANLISRGVTHRHDSSRSSMASSPRHASADEENEVGFSPGFGLEEERDEDGNWRWRHVDTLREGPTTSGATQVEAREPSGLESLVRATEGRSRNLPRLSFLRQQASSGVRQGEEGERRFVVGNRGKRPVSVDNGLVARGPSMKGHVVEEGEAAFL
ncbi:MAG: hypothetical protein LQ338_003464 [Usnochroma carphineum]|nr:MAG: hypothetical protein LQ338_003464 [Usnochroma carphineum]